MKAFLIGKKKWPVTGFKSQHLSRSARGLEACTKRKSFIIRICAVWFSSLCSSRPACKHTANLLLILNRLLAQHNQYFLTPVCSEYPQSAKKNHPSSCNNIPYDRNNHPSLLAIIPRLLALCPRLLHAITTALHLPNQSVCWCHLKYRI